MVFSQFNFLENDTRIIKYQNKAYKIKLMYHDCSEEHLPSLTPEQSHAELEQVFRAVLYADQREQKLPKIKTKHFLISVHKKGWKTSGKLNFKKDDTNVKCYSYLFEFQVSANPEMDVRYGSGRMSRSLSKHMVNCDDSDDNDIDYNSQEEQRSRSKSRNRIEEPVQRSKSRDREVELVQRSRLKTRKSDLTLIPKIKTKDCKVVLKRIDSQIFNDLSSVKLNDKRKGGKENKANRSLRERNISYVKQKNDSDSDIDSDSELEESDKDQYCPSYESVDIADLDDIESDEDENKSPKTVKERKSPKKRHRRKLYVPKYNKSYKNPNVSSDISSDSNSSLSDEEVEMSDGSFKPPESSQRRRKRMKKRKSPRKTSPNNDTQHDMSHRESSGASSDENMDDDDSDGGSDGSELENKSNRKINKDKNTPKDTEKRKSKIEIVERDSNHKGRQSRKSNLLGLKKGLKKKQLKTLKTKEMKSYVDESCSSEGLDSGDEPARIKRKAKDKKQQRYEVATSEEEMSSSDIFEDCNDNTDDYVPSDENTDDYVPSDDNMEEDIPSDDDMDFIPSGNRRLTGVGKQSASAKKGKITNKKGKDDLDLRQDKGDGDMKSKVRANEKNKEAEKETKQETKRTRKKKNTLIDENMNVENILGSFQEQNKNRDKSSDTISSRRSRKLFTAPCVPLERLPSTITGTVIIESPPTERKKTKNNNKRCSKSPDNETSDTFETASMKSVSRFIVTPIKSKVTRTDSGDPKTMDNILIVSPLGEKHFIQQKGLEENTKLSRSHPGPSRKSPRKRRSSGIWDVVETIITPIKRLMTK